MFVFFRSIPRCGAAGAEKFYIQLSVPDPASSARGSLFPTSPSARICRFIDATQVDRREALAHGVLTCVSPVVHDVERLSLWSRPSQTVLALWEAHADVFPGERAGFASDKVVGRMSFIRLFCPLMLCLECSMMKCKKKKWHCLRYKENSTREII